MPLTLFLGTHSVRLEGKACRDYTIRDVAGALRYTARAFRVPGRITVCAAHAPERPILSCRPRWSFPLTGRYDVREAAGGRALGVITRSGRFYDAAGRDLGRFRDARSFKEHLGEGVVTALVDGLIAGDGGTDAGVGPRAYVISQGRRRVGTLSRERVPFEVEAAPARPPGRLLRALRALLPRRAGDALFERRPPHAWKLQIEDTRDVAEDLWVSAAILAVELALW